MSRNGRRKNRLSGRFIGLLAIVGIALAAIFIMPRVLGLDEDADTPPLQTNHSGVGEGALSITGNHVTMAYTFAHPTATLGWHNLRDPHGLVNLITYNPRNGVLEVFTDQPAAFVVEDGDGGVLLIHITSLRQMYERIVIIDPGHGGADVGAIVAGAYESHIVLDISLYLYELFAESDSGIKAFMTRHGDDWVELSDRAAIANNLGDLFVSIHTNTYSDPAVAGTETLYNTPQSLFLAQTVQRHLVQELGTRDRGTIHRTDLYVLNTTRIPAVFAEIDFKTNPTGFVNLTSYAYQQRVAYALYNAIVEMFEGW
ncbi:MAG: N-acetylmuramoyl-L-alanine amidase [Defluviitaleaceae bacterium]|nr:N-acetylmuramoyl-L-alanine amidase [Defluviitaleaceae bacterium]